MVVPPQHKISHMPKHSNSFGVGVENGLMIGPTPRAPNTHAARQRSIPQQQLIFGSPAGGGSGDATGTTSLIKTTKTNSLNSTVGAGGAVISNSKINTHNNRIQHLQTLQNSQRSAAAYQN